MGRYAARVVGALRLDPATFEEIEHDEDAFRQAAGVVLVAGAATGVAQMPTAPVTGAVAGMALATLGWTLWVAVVWVVGTRWLAEPRTEADGAALLRTLGFAAAPGALRLAAVVPGIGGAVDVAAGVWTVLAMIVAVRQVLDFSTTWRAVAVCAIGWTAQALVLLATATALLDVPRPTDARPPLASPGGAGAVGAVKATGVVPAAPGAP